MTLLDQANFICGKINQTEAEDLAACKGFLRQRFLMLWADQLWKDSLVSYTQTLTPTGYALTSTWLPTKGILLLPPIIERVIALRSDTRHLNVQRPEFYYRVDLDVFAKTGQPSEFLILPPCVWEFDADALLRLSLADAAAKVTLDLLEADAINVHRSSLTLLVNPTYVTPATQRIDAVLKLVTENALTLEAVSSPATITLINARTDQAAVLLGTDPALLIFDQAYSLQPGETIAVQPDAYIGQQPQGTISRRRLNALATIATDLEHGLVVGDTVTISGVGGVGYNGTVVVTDVPAPQRFSYASQGLDEISVLDSGGTVRFPPGAIPDGLNFRGTITITGSSSYTFASSRLPILTLPAAETAAKIRQRVRLVNIPDAPLTIRVLGKRTAPTFSDDLDSPALTGVDNCLLAFAQGDMLQRERHYAKAQALYQEGQLLLNQLKMVETVQQAHEQRIMPEGGYGDENWNRLYGFSF